jgi:hypothetical protein
MASVNNQWTADHPLAFGDVEISTPQEAWEVDQPSEVPTYHKRRSAGLWVALASLAVAFAVAVAYGYSVISKDNAQLAWLPSLRESLSAVHGRVASLEANLQVWQDSQKGLAARVAEMNAAWKSDLNDARSYTAGLVATAYQRQHGELDRDVAILNAQIAEMVTREHTAQVRMAQLEQGLVRTQEELASVRETDATELAALRQQQAASQREIASLNNLLSTDEVDFSINNNQGEDLVPGISLHLTKTDTLHQQFQGWIWLAANRRAIWVRSQGIQRPVVFYPNPGSEAYELVVSRVNQKGAAGYLLVPRDAGAQQADLAADKGSNTGGSQVSF